MPCGPAPAERCWGIAVPWLLVSAAVGRWIGWVPNAAVVAWVASAIVLAALIDWGLRLAAG